MARLRGRVSILIDGELIPMLTMDENGKVEYALPDEKIKEYNDMMLANIERAETEYYAREMRT